MEPLSFMAQIPDSMWRTFPGATGLDPVTEAKLWRNPCWLAFRLNYLALRYNGPLYGWVRKVYGLSRPEFVIIYTLGLHDGARASDIVISYGFPKNTLSRAIARVAGRGLISKHVNRADRRNHSLSLTPAGRRLFAEALPRFVAAEERMLASLNTDERNTLSRLLAKIVLDSSNWPGEEDMDLNSRGERPCA